MDKATASSEKNQGNAVFVGNLKFDIEENSVIEHFSKCGKVSSVRIVRDSKTGIGKGFCYVNFENAKSVSTAVDLMNGTNLGGRDLRVSKSVNRPKKTLKLEEKGKAPTAFVPNHKKGTKLKKTQVLKVKKKQLKPSFEGNTFDADDKKAGSSHKKGGKSNVNKKGKKIKKLSQGERQRKLTAKKLS